MKQVARSSKWGAWLLLAALLLTTAAYWPGLSGDFLFDDYPNIVDNKGVQPVDAHLSSMVGAALSSPSSEFKRPLASLSFAANYLATGLDPYWMKLTNLIIHLLNGILIFLLARALLLSDAAVATASGEVDFTATRNVGEADQRANWNTSGTANLQSYAGIVAALISAGWMLLPINLTAVLYVVQRMESMANLFVLLGLIGYVTGRQHMLQASRHDWPEQRLGKRPKAPLDRNFILCLFSITIPTAFGLLAKETAVMLPLYALMIEWAIFRFGAWPQTSILVRSDRRIVSLFLLVLVVPMAIGLAWIVPSILKPETWATRDFTLTTRLLSEARIVVDYVAWTVLPTPDALSFYHDDFVVSTGLFTPWTTPASIAFLACLAALTLWLRSHRPLAALGLALFLSCQLLTATIIPLELIYEHRNYFASFGLLLALVPLLAARSKSSSPSTAAVTRAFSASWGSDAKNSQDGLPMVVPRYILLGGLMLCWTGLTWTTAYGWGNPLRLAENLANRAPQSPRAQYELGRTYIIYSRYEQASPFTKLAYAPLERAAAFPTSSILPEQALIFMNARMHLPLKNAWWDSLIAKLKDHKPTVQDESSLGALTQCVREDHCNLPKQRMMQAYLAALSHPDPSARLLAMYGDYAWNVLDDHALGERMTDDAIKAAPREPAYRITLVRMLAAQGRGDDARAALQGLQSLDIGGSLDTSLNELRALPGMQ